MYYTCLHRWDYRHYVFALSIWLCMHICVHVYTQTEVFSDRLSVDFKFCWCVCCFVTIICAVIITHSICFIAASSRFIQEGSASVAGQTPTIVALNFNKPPPPSVCPQVTQSTTSSVQSITSPRPGILRKRAHDSTSVPPYLLFDFCLFC